jgi:predicted CopG family antitoxin
MIRGLNMSCQTLKKPESMTNLLLFQHLGFNGHPFSKTNADEEPNLSEYFVAPVYFDTIIGDSKAPSSSIVLAPRGAGKTAQRRMVETRAQDMGFLAVTYDRFEFTAGEKVHDITLQYHLKNIITRILVSLLSYLVQFPDVVKHLTKPEKRELSLFIHTYIGELTGDEMQEMLKELRSIPEKLKKFWHENVGFMESVANFLLKKYDLDPIDLPDLRQEEKRLSQTYKHQLETLRNLAGKVGFESIYILIDKVDETEQTGNDAEKTYILIKPLIRDLELLGLQGYAFKFFLWDQIEDNFRVDARPDRVPQYKLNWDRKTLRGILSARLKAFSGGYITAFSELVRAPGSIDIDDVICMMANGSPRNMIRICERIFAIQAAVGENPGEIEMSSVDKGILEFSEVLFMELYGDTALKDMQRIGRELFTTNYLANDVLKISGQGARNKITAWVNSGLIKQIGTISVPSAKRPQNFYCAVDPAVVRVMHRSEPLEQFLKARWKPCKFCATENLINASLYPAGNDPTCRTCGRLLN